MANIKYNPADYNSAVKHMELGTRVQGQEDKVYIYVKVVDLDLVAGDVCLQTATKGTVTADYTGGTAHLSRAAGVALCAVTAGNYCFLQTKGYLATVNVHGDTAAASLLCPPSATDGRAEVWAPTTEDATSAQLLQGANIFAKASAADSSNIAPAFLFCD